MLRPGVFSRVGHGRGGLVCVEPARAERDLRGQPDPVLLVEEGVELQAERHPGWVCSSREYPPRSAHSLKGPAGHQGGNLSEVPILQTIG